MGDLHRWLVRPGGRFDLAEVDPRSTAGAPGDKATTVAATAPLLERLAGLQERLYAEGEQSLLLVLQAMLGNSDIKDDNNAFYELAEPFEGAKSWYVARDLGQTFGRTGVIDAPRGETDPISDDVRQDYGPVTVPSDQYFMMGDNRDNSEDSRYWGFLPKSYVKGKADFIYFSVGDESSAFGSVKWERLGKRVK